MHFTLFLSSEKSQRFLKVGWLALEQALVAPPEEDPHRHKKKTLHCTIWVHTLQIELAYNPTVLINRSGREGMCYEDEQGDIGIW